MLAVPPDLARRYDAVLKACFPFLLTTMDVAVTSAFNLLQFLRLAKPCASSIFTSSK